MTWERDGMTPGMALRESHLQGPQAGHVASLHVDSSLQIAGDKKAAPRAASGTRECQLQTSLWCSLPVGAIVTDTIGTGAVTSPFYRRENRDTGSVGPRPESGF